MKTKKELKYMLCELIINEHIIVSNEDEELFVNFAKKLGVRILGGAITAIGKCFYIEL